MMTTWKFHARSSARLLYFQEERGILLCILRLARKPGDQRRKRAAGARDSISRVASSAVLASPRCALLKHARGTEGARLPARIGARWPAGALRPQLGTPLSFA